MTVSTNDWSSKENAKLWRKDLTDTINSIKQKMGMTENFWEHRSFKEQGLEIVPQIHLGEKASAMERAGIQTARGDINREIIANNAVVEMARAAYEQAKKNLMRRGCILYMREDYVRKMKGIFGEMVWKEEKQ